MKRSAEAKIVLVRRPTRLDGLRRRFNTAGQAKFYLGSAAKQEAAGVAPGGGGRARASAVDDAKKVFDDLEREDDLYQDALAKLRRDLADLLPLQEADRTLLPTLTLGPGDVIVTVGQDGLVANAAKYALARPIVAVNPDPATIDGVLLPFRVDGARGAVQRVLASRATVKHVTFAEAILSDGQRLLAFNDLFVGQRTHVSARYQLTVGERVERQSSSGVLVSTGAGSTGWLSSVYHMAAGVVRGKAEPLRLAWDDRRLAYVVREPFVSKTSAAGIVCGLLPDGGELVVESAMPEGGVVFSDGVEADFLQFNTGATLRVRAARERATLVVG